MDLAHGWMVPYLYVLFLIMLPFELPAWAGLLIGAATGLVMDIFASTPGMHTSASCGSCSCASTCGARLPRDGYEFGMHPTVPSTGLAVRHQRGRAHRRASPVALLRGAAPLRRLRHPAARSAQRAAFTLGLCLRGKGRSCSPRAPPNASAGELEGRKYVLIAGGIRNRLHLPARLFWIQVVDDRWKASAASISRRRKITGYPARGFIYDRNGKLLVANTPVYDLMMVPREVNASIPRPSHWSTMPPDPQAADRRGAHVFAVQAERDREAITARQFAAISVHLHSYPGFYGRSRTLRTYPPRVGGHMPATSAK
ncbi:MAG: hypothetical protein IPM46_00235 [Flavobacteriales bacterium]|nr:hypothetical protein [Flavobacteriales bacterium]